MNNLKVARLFHSFLKEKGVFDEYKRLYKQSDFRTDDPPVSSSAPADLLVNSFDWRDSGELTEWRWADLSLEWRFSFCWL